MEYALCSSSQYGGLYSCGLEMTPSRLTKVDSSSFLMVLTFLRLVLGLVGTLGARIPERLGPPDELVEQGLGGGVVAGTRAGPAAIGGELFPVARQGDCVADGDGLEFGEHLPELCHGVQAT